MSLNSEQMLPARVRKMRQMEDLLNVEDIILIEIERIIDEMLDHIDDMPDSDKKLMMNLLIEKVEIYEEKQKDGRWVKSVQFKIPLNVDGKLVDTMFFDDEDTENSLSNEKHVETCVLLSKLG